MTTSDSNRGIGMTSQRTRERLMQRLREQGISNTAVLDVMRSVPRHLFLDEALSQRAYENSALPIGYNQTLSQPYIVARMTELLIENNPQRVLEIGTGSGYQTAVLSFLVDKVYTVERILPLLDQARSRLRKLGIRNVHFKHADGGFGWPLRGPFDAIMATAAPERVPEELLAQLADGGRLVVPEGGRDGQQLCVYERRGKQVKRVVHESVIFVPLVSGVVA